VGVAGSTAPITREHLLVEDADTPADEIVYTLLTAPTNGDVIVGGVGVTSFTQRLIDDKRLLFAHRGTSHDSVSSFGIVYQNTKKSLEIVLPMNFFVFLIDYTYVTQRA